MLNSQHWNTLQALMDCLIPPDDFPGAWDAGVGDYLQGQFERDLRDKLDLYQVGLEALEAEAITKKGIGFTALDAPAQDELLIQIEKGEVTGTWAVDPVRFFQMVVEQVMEGYYSNPGNGGNRERVAWKMIGFEVDE